MWHIGHSDGQKQCPMPSTTWRHTVGSWHFVLPMLLSTAMVLALTGCGAGTMLRVVPVDADGNFPTRYPLPASDILVAAPEPVVPQGGFATVSVAPRRSAKLLAFFKESMVRGGLFAHVYSLTELAAKAAADGYPTLAGDGKEPPDLAALRPIYGPFIVLELAADVQVPAAAASLTAVDPVTGTVTFYAEKPLANAYAIDQQALFPLFNALADWIRGNRG